MRLLPYGDRAVLIEVDGPPTDLRAALLGGTGIEEMVPAARTLLVRFDPDRTDAAASRRPPKPRYSIARPSWSRRQ